jgi:hypothetical protein
MAQGPRGQNSDIIWSFLRAGLLLLLVRILLSLVSNSYSIFFPSIDIFADSLKSGIAQVSITATLTSDPRVADWPAVFREYVLHNDYLGPNSSIRHSTPLGLLQLMGIGRALLHFHPFTVMGLLTILYCGGAWLISTKIKQWGGSATITKIILPLLFSYPALFMLNRGNFHSGFTSLAVISYLATASFGRGRRAGWLALALAINLRPNVAVFALMELWREERPIDAIRSGVIIGVLAIMIGAVSLAVATHIDPRYTLQGWLEALALYRENYLVGDDGTAWNAALENVGKVARMAGATTPPYSPFVAAACLVVGVLLCLWTVWLTWNGRLTAPQLAFALAALCSHFTPVLAEYHVLVYAAPLLLYFTANKTALSRSRWRRALPLILSLQVLAYLYHLAPSGTMLAVLCTVSLALPWAAERLTTSDEATPRDRIDGVLLLACLAELSPIGGEYSHGVAISLVGVSSLAWLLVRITGEPNCPR